MLYLYTGNDHYSLRQETQKWKSAFVEKHGDFGLAHIRDIRDIDINFLSETLFSQGLFGGIKLTIIEIEIASKSVREDLGELDQDLSKPDLFPGHDVISYLENCVDSIPEEHRVLIVYFSPDKRTSFFKNLKAASKECKVFDSSRDPDVLLDILHKRYNSRVSIGALRKILEYKGVKLGKIIPELEKLCILHSFVESVHVEKYIIPELEESVFVLGDALLSQNKKQVFSLVETILSSTNIYLLYHSLLSSLRLQRYVVFLRERGLSSFTIKEILSLGNRSFLVDKSYKLSHTHLKVLYQKLSHIDTQMKQGNLLGGDEADFRYEMEKVFIEILA